VRGWGGSGAGDPQRGKSESNRERSGKATHWGLRIRPLFGAADGWGQVSHLPVVIQVGEEKEGLSKSRAKGTEAVRS